MTLFPIIGLLGFKHLLCLRLQHLGALQVADVVFVRRTNASTDQESHASQRLRDCRKDFQLFDGRHVAGFFVGFDKRLIFLGGGRTPPIRARELSSRAWRRPRFR